MTLEVGDRVRIDVPVASDPDHRYHGEVGVIASVLRDDLGALTGDPRDDALYRVAFEDDALGSMSFRHHDLERVESADVKEGETALHIN